jgi:hypothetical protein
VFADGERAELRDAMTGEPGVHRERQPRMDALEDLRDRDLDAAEPPVERDSLVLAEQHDAEPESMIVAIAAADIVGHQQHVDPPDQVQHLESRAADLDLQAVVANLVPRDRRGRQREAPGHAGVIDDQAPKPNVGAAQLERNHGLSLA